MSVKHITAYLEAHPDGASPQEMAEALRRRLDHIQKSLKRMRRFAYIDRYQDNNPIRPVWLLVQVPEDCPRPERKATA